MGFDDNEKLGRGEEGGRAALSMWTDYMEYALRDKPVAKLEAPPGMVKVKVDGSRGTESKSSTAQTEEVMEEYRLMLMGPDPEPDTGPAVAVKKKPAAKTAAKPAAQAKPARAAPRSVDDLF